MHLIYKSIYSNGFLMYSKYKNLDLKITSCYIWASVLTNRNQQHPGFESGFYQIGNDT